MRDQHPPSRRMGMLRRDRKAAVAVISGLVAPPTLMLIGLLVDYVRLNDSQAILQSAVDSAAIAGAAAYTDSAHAGAAASAAQNSFKHTQFPPLMMNVALSGMPATSQGATNRAGSANNVLVSASATVQSTFASLFQSSYTVQASARASNPVVQFSVMQNKNWGGTASDWNSVYVYAVPTDSTGKPDFTKVPDPTTIPTSQQEIGSNCTPNSSQPCVSEVGGFVDADGPKLNITATTVFGFAFQNQTAGRGGGYTNQYGSTTMEKNWLFSSLLGAGLPPSYYTDQFRTAAGYRHSTYSNAGTGTGKKQNDCALQVQLVPISDTLPAVPPANGQCVSSTSSQSGTDYTKLTCAQLTGKMLVFWWGDMGAPGDNYNWDDIYFSVTCNATTGQEAKVVLTQ